MANEEMWIRQNLLGRRSRWMEGLLEAGVGACMSKLSKLMMKDLKM